MLGSSIERSLERLVKYFLRVRTGSGATYLIRSLANLFQDIPSRSNPHSIQAELQRRRVPSRYTEARLKQSTLTLVLKPNLKKIEISHRAFHVMREQLYMAGITETS